ncbi:glycoside hydrolase family 108 protein [Meridianimarinicoccus sp. RP-17]|uniref:glycoside hydrolase family 108 protein n=1 Tax=Meridianimarinicoccus zhengii TaxID=2056810 RepID=UPI000DABF81A|nr:glycosyl hydrolase 108 family protein [Phycocomes zhengii]
MNDRFAALVPLLLKHEGRFVNDPKDPGGATNMGITIGTLAQWRGGSVTPDDVLALSQDEAMEIYRAWYWTQPGIGRLPVGIDRAVFDFAVHSGAGRAIMALQRVLEVADDGRLGQISYAAAAKADPIKTVERLIAGRKLFLSRLSIWPRYRNGWTARLIELQAAALHDIAHPPTPPRAAPAAWSFGAWLKSLFTPTPSTEH